jgi:hypothetical protein
MLVVWAEKLRCGGVIGFRGRTCGVIVLPDLGHLPKPAGWEHALPRGDRAPVAQRIPGEWR